MNAFLNNVLLLKFILINVLDIVFCDLPFFSIFVDKHNHNSLILRSLMVSIPLNKYTALKLPKLLLIENLV